ncbi:FAD-binding oxidoreductase [Clostridium sp. D2Q-11]|uniref:FAD-binding oxidoreductase n=1 Tax=Anaeromonas frigoriresistens TaxID=2683708 RepID=A0A942ZAA3_9FIRM|nr:FAD-binding oxidoreductase [Anaeromonas frigoriresistens]
MKVGIIGGGVFGLYCAKVLLDDGHRVDVYEQGAELGQCATKVNQARLHNGYHYPRSDKTAKQCIEGFNKFRLEFKDAINENFKQYYAIAKEGSKVSSVEYLNFLERLNIPSKIVNLNSDIINSELIDLTIEAIEYSFDWKKIVDKLRQDVIDRRGYIYLGHKVLSGEVKDENKKLKVLYNGDILEREYDIVLNIAYSNINGLNEKFGLSKLPLEFEMCEVCLIELPHPYKNYGITIMDGDFTSVMPFGLTGFHSITNVRRTPHERSCNGLPLFSCNKKENECRPDNIEICIDCPYRLQSGYEGMKNFAIDYIPFMKYANVIDSMFTVKTILSDVDDTDERPSVIFEYPEAKGYYVIFAGKVNTIMDIGLELISKIKEV